MPGDAAVDVPASAPRRKIFMTADAVGGVWQYTVDLARAFANFGAEILIATMGPRPNESQREQLLSIGPVTLVESEYALEWMPTPWRDVDAAAQWLLETEAGFGADLVHLNGYAHASLPWRKPVIVVAHSCVFSWWRAVHGCAPGSEWNEYRKRIRDGLLAANAVIAPSASMAANLAEEYGIGLSKIHVIHNFCRDAGSGPTGKQNFILAAGRVWDAAKNLELLSRIAPQLDMGSSHCRFRERARAAQRSESRTIPRTSAAL